MSPEKAGRLAEPTRSVAAKESVLRISHCQTNSQIYHNLNPDNDLIHFCGHYETIWVFLCNFCLVCQFGTSLQSWYLKQNPFLIQDFSLQSKPSAYLFCRNAERHKQRAVKVRVFVKRNLGSSLFLSLKAC